MKGYKFRFSKTSEEEKKREMKFYFGIVPLGLSIIPAVIGTGIVYRALTGECGEIDKIPWYAEMAIAGLCYTMSGISGCAGYRGLKEKW